MSPIYCNSTDWVWRNLPLLMILLEKLKKKIIKKKRFTLLPAQQGLVFPR